MQSLIGIGATGSIDGITFLVEKTTDEFKKAIIIKELPQNDFPILQDMGKKARTVRFTAWFIDDNYKNHVKLLNLLADVHEHTFIHPRYGRLVGRIEFINAPHDDKVESIALDINFVVSEGVASLQAYKDVGSNALRLAKEGLSSVPIPQPPKPDIIITKQAEIKATNEKNIPPTSTIAAALASITGKLSSWVAKVSGIVSTVEGKLDTVAILPNSIIATVVFAENLPGRTIGAFANVCGRYIAALQTIKNSPARFIQTLSFNLETLQNTLFPNNTDDSGTLGAFLHVAALSIGNEAAQRFSEDQQRRSSNSQTYGIDAFDNTGHQVGLTTPLNIMDVTEIENCLAIVTIWANKAKSIGRENPSITAMISALIDHVNEIKLETDSIKTIMVYNEIPLLLVLLNNALSYRDADRVLAINPLIANPNYVRGEVKIYG